MPTRHALKLATGDRPSISATKISTTATTPITSNDLTLGTITNIPYNPNPYWYCGCGCNRTQDNDPEIRAIKKLSEAFDEFFKLVDGKTRQSVGDYISKRFDLDIEWPDPE